MVEVNFFWNFGGEVEKVEEKVPRHRKSARAGSPSRFPVPRHFFRDFFTAPEIPKKIDLDHFTSLLAFFTFASTFSRPPRPFHKWPRPFHSLLAHFTNSLVVFTVAVNFSRSPRSTGGQFVYRNGLHVKFFGILGSVKKSRKSASAPETSSASPASPISGTSARFPRLFTPLP